MNIDIVIWSLFETRGGLERVGCDLARAMRERGHAVTVFYNASRAPLRNPVYPLPPEIALRGLFLDYNTPGLADAREKILAQAPDVLIAMFSWESLLWFPALLKGSNVRFVISEHSAPDNINSKWNAYEHNCCLLTGDAVHVLTDTYARLYPPSLAERIRVIPNPVCLPEPDRPRQYEKTRYTLLSAGRFDNEDVKRFSLLIRAFALLHREFPDWDLEICGDGTSFDAYAKLAAGLGLKNRIRLPGMIPNIAEKYAQADIFCIPSRVEGFPMSLLESAHFSLPAVGFAACAGTNEIIRHGENGYLAQEMTPQSLADDLARLMRNPELRRTMGDAAKALLSRYSPGRVYDMWEDLLVGVRQSGKTRIQEILEPDRRDDPGMNAARELLRRKHPFDRSVYVRMHALAKKQGRESPFSDRHIAGFIKKRKKLGLSGPYALLAMLRRFFRRFRLCLR